MKKGLFIVGGVVAIVILLVITFAGTYNDLVSKREDIESSLATISVQLERRADLIPNLVSTVKGYASHEKEVINDISDARANLLKADDVEDMAEANQELNDAISNLLVVVENYPDLKANTNFIQLQDELAGTENRIAVARRDYNEVVKKYNKEIKKFPKNILANMFDFDKADYFEAKESANEVPEISFD